MLNLQGKINEIKDAKDNIKAAIIAKGVSPSGNISTYAVAIGQIDTTNNQTKTVTTNGVVRYDDGYTGLEQVTVNVNQATQSKNITANGTYTPAMGYIGFNEVVVDVPFFTEDITVNPSTSQQIIQTEVDGIKKVTVNPVTSSIDANIVATNIKSGVNILGVNGSVVELKGQTKTLSLTTSGTSTISPDPTYNGITSISITPNLQSKTATVNGTITADSGYCGLSEVDVDVDLNLQNKTFTQNGTYTADSGYTGFDRVTVNVNLSLQTKTITANGDYRPDSGYNGFENVTVNVQPNLQNKTVTVNGSYTADSGYDGLGTVTVNTQSVKNTTATIITNGTYTPSSSYTGYSSVTVNVPQSIITGSGIPRVVDNGIYSQPITQFGFSLPNGVTNLGKNALYGAFMGCTNLVNCDISSLTTLTNDEALSNFCRGCTNLTGTLDLSNLTTINGISIMEYAFPGASFTDINFSSLETINGRNAMNNAFYSCDGLTSISFPSLTTVSGYASMSSAFTRCSNLIEVDLSSLITINDNNTFNHAFDYCTKLTTIDLSSLTTITGSGLAAFSMFNTALTTVLLTSLSSITGSNALQFAFQRCTQLSSLSFPSLNSASFGTNTNQFNLMLSQVTGCTVHFPSNLQSVIGSWSDVTNGFGGTNTTVLFDLPATT